MASAWQETYTALGSEIEAARTATVEAFMAAPAESAIDAPAAIPPIPSRQQRADANLPLSSGDRTKVVTAVWRAIAKATLKHIGPVSSDDSINITVEDDADGVPQLNLRAAGGGGSPSSDFVTGFFIDFQALPQQELTAGVNTIAGKSWYVRNPTASSWYGSNPHHINPPNGLGFGFSAYSQYPIVSATLFDLGLPPMSKLSEMWVFARLSYDAVNAVIARLGLGTEPVDVAGLTPLEYIAEQGGSADGSLRQVGGRIATASAVGNRYPVSGVDNTADYTLAIRWLAGHTVEIYSGNVEVSAENSSEYMRGAVTLRATLHPTQTELGGTPEASWSDATAAISLTHGVNATTGGIYWKQLRIDYVEAGTQKGESGDPGNPGSPGAPGTDGSDGTDGAWWFNGTTAPPDGDGLPGDYYLRTTTGDVFRKGAGTWGAAVGNIKGAPGTDGTDGAPGGGALATVYEVDFTALTAANLLTGGDGTKTIDGKTWTLYKSDNLTTGYVNDGSHAGLYLRNNAVNTGQYWAPQTCPRLWTPISNLTGGLEAHLLPEVWLWGMLSTPHTPNANYEGMSFGVCAGPMDPATQATWLSATILLNYNGSLIVSAQYENATQPAGLSYTTHNSKDVYVFRLVSGMSSWEMFVGTSVDGNFPDRSSLTHLGYVVPRNLNVVQPALVRSTATQLWLWFTVFSGNTVGAADLLVSKLKIETRS